MIIPSELRNEADRTLQKLHYAKSYLKYQHLIFRFKKLLGSKNMHRMISESDLSTSQTENSMTHKKEAEQALSLREALRECDEVET